MKVDQKFLVHGPDAAQFLNLVLYDTGRKALLGDPSSVPESVRGQVLEAHRTLGDCVQKLSQLQGDATRPTLYQKHLAAKQLATKVANHLKSTANVLERTVVTLEEQFMAGVDNVWGPSASKAGLHAEYRARFRELTATEGGLDLIKKAAQEDAEVGAALWASSPFLTGIPKASLDRLKDQALQAHLPDMWRKLEKANELRDMVGKTKSVLEKVEQSFFNEQVVSQGEATRVEV